MNILEIVDLTIEYPGRRSHPFARPPAQRVVHDVSFVLPRGTTLALVGESGSGKTSIARAILGLAPVTKGRIRLAGSDLVGRARDTRAFGRQVQMVFQQPAASLDPRMSVGASIAEPLRHLTDLAGPAIAARTAELLELVGLTSSHTGRYPRHLSGGQRQRVAIARAIAVSPSLVICDEPTSALDVSVQAQVLNLLMSLQADLGLSYLFITHDLAVVRQVADMVAVLQSGRLVETGATDAVLATPRDPYTRALLAAVPRSASLADPTSGSGAVARPGADVSAGAWTQHQMEGIR